MFESMQKELLSLAEYLQRITVYEDLYGDSKEMQRLFFNSYTNIIHFWHRTHEECKHKGTSLGYLMVSSIDGRRSRYARPVYVLFCPEGDELDYF